MLPNSVTVGEKSSSSAIVAALMNFIVIIGVRKHCDRRPLPRSRATRAKMEPARDDEAGDFLRAERRESVACRCRRRETFEIRLLCRAEHLDPLLGEIGIEAGEGEAGAIDCRLADAPLEADSAALEFELQRFGVLPEKAFHRHDRHVPVHVASRSDGLDDRFRAHGAEQLYRGGGETANRRLTAITLRAGRAAVARCGRCR